MEEIIIKTFYDFVNSINHQDLENIYKLLADDHKFIDSQGNEVIGREKMKAGWAGYFQLFPVQSFWRHGSKQN